MISVGMLRDVWAYRGFIMASVRREFNSKYLRTQFGFLWIIIQPLSMITIYTLVFAEIMKPSLPGHASKFAYSIYLCAGVLTWGFFSELLGRSVGIFVQNANLLKKASIPKLCLPIIVILSSLTNYAIIMAIFIAFLILTGNFSGFPLIAALPVAAIIGALAIGLGILLGTINVFYRDVEQTMGIVLQFWFWLTPIVYVSKTLPGFAAGFLKLNPMWPLIDAMHTIFLDGRFPGWTGLVYPAVLSAALVYLGMFAFWKLNGEIVDEL